MKQRPTGRPSSEKIIRDTKRNTRKQYSAEEKIRIVLDGVRGEDCPSSNKWDRCLVLLRECFAHHFHVTRRVVDSANDVSR